MTKYYYTCKEDQNLIKKSFNNVALMIFGKRAQGQKMIDLFVKVFEKHVSQVNIYPQGTTTKHLSNRTPGVYRITDGKRIIEMLGYNRAMANQHSWIKHEGAHEFCHSFVDLLPKMLEKNQKGIIKNGFVLKSNMGKIQQSNPITGEIHYYGKFFNETMMDIITSMAINNYDSNSNSSSVDDILRTNYKCWGNEKTAYSIFTSITRLTIAAFSNNGFVNYQDIVNKGGSIFDIDTTMHNGSSKKVNDFLYGIVFDQLHIEEEFDKIMGEGYYQTFCKCLDELFMLSLRNQKLPSDAVKRVMNILPDFLNKKLNYYKQNGIIDLKGANQIIFNFNTIWNSMQVEYNSYFSDSDIDVIAKRAGRR